MSKPDYVAGFFGSRGSGKSTALIAEVKRQKEKRLLVFDPKREPRYTTMGTVTESLIEAVNLVQHNGRSRARFSVVYRPPALDVGIYDLFSAFCDLAMWATDCLLVVDEGAMVTRSSWGPPGWRRVVNIGRDPAHVRIALASQRPTQVDKDFFGNMTHLNVFRLNNAHDLKKMADNLCVPVAELPRGNFDFIARDLSGNTNTTGRTRKG